jgi:anti-sigma factor RsiW
VKRGLQAVAAEGHQGNNPARDADRLEELLQRCERLAREVALLQRETDDLRSRISQARIERNHARALAGLPPARRPRKPHTRAPSDGDAN